MGSDVEPQPSDPGPVRPRRRLLPLLVLAAGGLVAAFLASRSPRDQHLQLVLGRAANLITGLELQYVSEDGEVARDVRMAFSDGQAPRVVAHEPKLADGTYRVRIELETREGRRTVERQVTLRGGTTQVDLASVVTPSPPDPGPPRDRAKVPGTSSRQ